MKLKFKRDYLKDGFKAGNVYPGFAVMDGKELKFAVYLEIVGIWHLVPSNFMEPD